MKDLLISVHILFLAIAVCPNIIAQSTKQKIMKTQQTGYAPINGLKMYYEIHGEGKPLVLIHGGGSTRGQVASADSRCRRSFPPI